jgi:hypothetical protein
MSHLAASALEHHAPKIRDRFLAVAGERIDPAIWLDAGGVFFVVEHLSLTATIARHDGAEELQSVPGSIVVAVVDGEEVAVERVPDPRMYPERWPWTA